MANVNAEVVELTETSFANEVLDAQQPVLVDFWAQWCGPCKALAPTIDRLAADFGGKVKVAKVDIDQAPKVAEEYGIRGVPSVIIFNNGETVARIVGPQPHASYKNVLDGVLSGANGDEISDVLLQSSEGRISFIMSASLDEIRETFIRHPELSSSPVKDGLTPLGIALRAGLPLDKQELFASYVSTLSFEELVGLGRVEKARAAIAENPELINQPGPDGIRPLTIAIINSQSECVDLLLSLGADPDPAGDGIPQVSPIEIAVMQNDLALVERLLDQGANVQRKTVHAGGTLLHLAVQVSDKDLVTLFVNRGIDPMTTNDNGETPYEANLKALTRRLATETAPEKVEAIQRQLEQLEAIRLMLI